MNSQQEDLDDEYMENEENMGNEENMDNDENMNDMEEYKTEIIDAYHEFVNKINKAKNDVTELRDQGQVDYESKDIQNIQKKLDGLEERKNDLEREYYERFDELLPGTERGGKKKKSRKSKKAYRKSKRGNKKGGKKSKRRSTKKQKRRRK